MKYSFKHLKWVAMFARGVMTAVGSTSEYMYILLLSQTLCGSSQISCYMVLGQTRATYPDCGVREKVSEARGVTLRSRSLIACKQLTKHG